MNLRILLVDDEPNVLETLSALLGDEMDVVTCTSPERALRLVEAEPFHVVCTDFEMPGVNGAELLRRIASRHPHIGTLLVTGAQQYLRSNEGSLHYVLLKPVDPARFISIVQHLGRISQMKRSVSTMAAVSVDPPSRPGGRR